LGERSLALFLSKVSRIDNLLNRAFDRHSSKWERSAFAVETLRQIAKFASPASRFERG
jgi:hypothetical protein